MTPGYSIGSIITFSPASYIPPHRNRFLPLSCSLGRGRYMNFCSDRSYTAMSSSMHGEHQTRPSDTNTSSYKSCPTRLLFSLIRIKHVVSVDKSMLIMPFKYPGTRYKVSPFFAIPRITSFISIMLSCFIPHNISQADYFASFIAFFTYVTTLSTSSIVRLGCSGILSPVSFSSSQFFNTALLLYRGFIWSG